MTKQNYIRNILVCLTLIFCARTLQAQWILSYGKGINYLQNEGFLKPFYLDIKLNNDILSLSKQFGKNSIELRALSLEYYTSLMEENIYPGNPPQQIVYIFPKDHLIEFNTSNIQVNYYRKFQISHKISFQYGGGYAYYMNYILRYRYSVYGFDPYINGYSYNGVADVAFPRFHTLHLNFKLNFPIYKKLGLTLGSDNTVFTNAVDNNQRQYLGLQYLTLNYNIIRANYKKGRKGLK